MLKLSSGVQACFVLSHVSAHTACSKGGVGTHASLCHRLTPPSTTQQGYHKSAVAAMSGKRIQPGPGQESVWDYPRPPACEPSDDHVKIFLGDQVLADTRKAYRVLETSHPPVYYIPQADIKMERLQKTTGNSSYCEWKGSATYFNAKDGEKSIAWTYESPTPRFAPIKNYLAFYPSKPAEAGQLVQVQKAFINDEEVKAQQGDFYGGWITGKITGPFKGGMGTWGW